jgi:hypothetical protein
VEATSCGAGGGYARGSVAVMSIQPPIPSGTMDTAARLAEQHDARTLAAAIATRLVADGRAELAAVLTSLLAEAGIIDGNPGNPHVPSPVGR